MMTADEAIAAIVSAVPSLSEEDVRGLLACTDEERVLIIQSYRDASKMPKASSWSVILTILGECVALANMVIPISGAIQGAYGVARL
jgi:hypothetical protein